MKQKGGRMMTNEEYKGLIHKMIDRIESNKGLKIIFTVAHTVFIHEGVDKKRLEE